MIRHTFLLLLLFGILSARGQDPSHTAARDPECRQKAERQLDEALRFMEKKYYRKDQVSWTDLEARAKEHLRTAGSCEDAYASVSWCLQQLNEPHSFVMSSIKAARYTGDEEDLAPPPPLSELVGEIRGEWLQDSIAYLTVPWVSTTDSFICERIADSLQTVIARLDARGVSRWIVDLRKNSGGNCWPMLTGIGPLLGDGICGYFVGSNQWVPITYRDGSTSRGRHIVCRVSKTGYHLQHNNPSIVILTGHRTVSAGETVALAFRGRTQTCFIGEPTAGLTTGNTTYTLPDKSMLVLTVCQEADHAGHICYGSIQPDQEVDPAPQTACPDPVKDAAVTWLRTK